VIIKRLGKNTLLLGYGIALADTIFGAVHTFPTAAAEESFTRSQPIWPWTTAQTE